MENRTCKYCGNELNGQPEFCDGVCAENYAEREEDREFRKVMKDE